MLCVSQHLPSVGRAVAVDPDVQQLIAQEDIHYLGGVCNNDAPK
jgi:hypothetical protein